MRPGAAFQHEIGTSLQKLKDSKYGDSLYWERISDTAAYGARCYKCGEPLYPNMMMPKQPADHYFIFNSFIVFLEEKSSTNGTSYNMDWIKPHQLEKAIQIINAGGHYYFLMNRRVPKDMSMFIVEPHSLMELIANMEKKHMVRWTTVERYALLEIVRDTTDATWDLEPLMDEVKT